MAGDGEGWGGWRPAVIEQLVDERIEEGEADEH